MVSSDISFDLNLHASNELFTEHLFIADGHLGILFYEVKFVVIFFIP